MENEVVNKVQPNDTIAEQAVLGSMLVDTEAVISAVEILKAEDFYREDNREIYAAMLEIYSAGKHIDMITLMEQLRLRGSLERVGGNQYIAMLIDNVPTTSNIENYVKIVEEKSVLRQLIKTANEILKMGYSQTEEVDTIIEQTEKKVFDVLQNRNSKGYASMKEILVTAFDMIETMYQNKNKVSGIESGFIDLDNKISGLNPSDLIIVAARPAMGKSAFALNIATNAAIKANVPVAIFSLEMSKEQMTNRILCSEAMVDSKKVRTGKIEDEDWTKLAEASGALSTSQIFIDDTPGISVMEIRAKCRKLKLEKNIGLVVIDYIQLVQGSNKKNSSREQEISEISRSLKILAKEIGVPVIALSQLSRSVEQRPDHRPMLSDLRESGAIEQDADIVMFLYRDDYYNENSEKKNVAEVILAKHRGGSTGTVELAWMGNYTKFASLEKYRE